MKRVNVSVDSNIVFVIINNLGMTINAGVNGKNWMRKAYAINDLFGILVTVNVTVINPVILASI